MNDTTVPPLEISAESLFEKLLIVVFLGLGSIELEWNMSPQGVSRAHHFLHTFFSRVWGCWILYGCWATSSSNEQHYEFCSSSRFLLGPSIGSQLNTRWRPSSIRSSHTVATVLPFPAIIFTVHTVPRGCRDRMSASCIKLSSTQDGNKDQAVLVTRRSSIPDIVLYKMVAFFLGSVIVRDVNRMLYQIIFPSCWQKYTIGRGDVCKSILGLHSCVSKISNWKRPSRRIRSS